MAEEKKLGDLNRTEKQAIILSALMKEGYNQNQASKLLEVSRVRVCQVNKKIKQGVLSPLVNKAKKSVALLLEGKPVGDMQSVKGADVLAAAKMVLDRADPVVNKTENTNISVQYEIKPEERDRYKAALGIIDAEFEVLPENQKLLDERKLLPEGSNNGSSPGFEPEDEGPIPSPSTITDDGTVETDNT